MTYEGIQSILTFPPEAVYHSLSNDQYYPLVTPSKVPHKEISTNFGPDVHPTLFSTIVHSPLVHSPLVHSPLVVNAIPFRFVLVTGLVREICSFPISSC